MWARISYYCIISHYNIDENTYACSEFIDHENSVFVQSHTVVVASCEWYRYNVYYVYIGTCST